MEANPKILCISELLQQSLPLTGTSSLNPSHPLHSHTKPNNNSPQQHSTNPLYNSSILSPVNHPTLIIGTLNLPIHAKCPSSNSTTYSACFSLSDGSAFLCCDLIDLENIPNVIGKKIHVLSWNFIPFKKCGGGGGGGFLEIIRWCLPPASPFSLAPCSEEDPVTNNGYSILGRLKSVSPVSAVPCTFQDRNAQITSTSTNMSGFLAELFICKCKLCNSKNFVMGFNCWLRWKDGHCFSEGVKVYFFGDALSWHPMVSKLIGKAVCLTGLKKKLVYIGKEDSRLMFTTTDKATFHMILLPTEELSPFKRSVIRGKGESSAYSGIVTGVYMQGMVIEFDEKVCLLLTDQLLAPPHFVRVGALISLRNVHFVQTNFSWARVLLLGACFKTSIKIKSFSPLESQCHIRSQSQSLLGKFTASLVFSARFWFLLTISSFMRKFAGFYSEKEILGSKHKEGLVQMYAKSCLPSCVFRPRNGLLMEFCNHDLCGCGDEQKYSYLKLAVPISTFINHCEVLWLAMLAKMQTDYKISGKSNHFSCEGKSYCRSNRRIVSSGDLGLVLLGTLQISSSSGRLQLVDSSGSIEVVIPDISSNWEASNVYEVRYYNIIIEGVPAEVDAPCLPTSESFSFRNIFHHVLPNKEIKPSAIYVHFYMRDTTCLNFGLRLPYMDGSYNLMRTGDGMFHLLLVTHKFPAKENFQGDSIVSNKSSSFVEAMILPWSLLLSGDHRDILINGFSRGSLREHLQIAHRQNLIANSCRKKLKLAHGSNGVLFSALEDNIGEVGSVSRAHNNLSAPHKLPCLVLLRNFSNQKQARQGVLLHNEHGAIDGVVSKPSDKYFLLEFKSEVFKNYELLQVGGLYVMEYAKEELSQNIKNHHYATARKRLVTSQMPLWSISLSSDQVISPSELVKDDLLKTTSIRNGMVPCECSPAGGLFFQQCIRQIPETCSHDVNLHLSVDAMNLLKFALKPLEGKLIKPPCLLRVTPDPHTCARTMMNASAHSFDTANHSGTLPQGDLISLHGNVVDVHNFSCYSDIKTHVSHGGIGDMHQTGLYKGRPSNICIHLSKDNDIVKLRGSLSKHGCPLGMGPSAVATFHRVLVKGQCEFMLTPTSFIVVDSIKEVVPDNDESLVLTELDSTIPNELETVASSLISEFMQCFESKPMKFSGRVVAIQVLVLEKQNNAFEYTLSREQSKTPAFNIPFAGFILDDGSSSCCCWANAERAATLLRLHECCLVNTHHSSGWRKNRGKLDKTRMTANYHLNRILKKHSRITVKNHGSIFVSSGQDLLFSASSDDVFSSSDENLLKVIITNACSSSVFSIIGSAMDSNATAKLEKDLSDLGMMMDSMQNIWVSEVLSVNHLTEARTLIEELVKQ